METLGQRHNNPLNIKAGPLTQQDIDEQRATIGDAAEDGGNFLRFNTPEDGFNAADRMLQSKRYKDLTIEQAMHDWSNGGYRAHQALPDIESDTIVGDLDPATRFRLLQNMAKLEGWSSEQPLTESDSGRYAKLPNGQWIHFPPGMSDDMIEKTYRDLSGPKKTGPLIPPVPTPVKDATNSYWEGIKQNLPSWETVRHPVDSIYNLSRDLPQLPEAMIAEATAQNQQSQAGYTKMTTAPDMESKLGGFADWVMHSLGQIPVIGPPVAHMYETAKTDPIKSAGELTGLLTMTGGRKKPTTGVATAVADAKQPLTWAERTGNPALQKIENLAENSIGGGSVFKRFREAQRTARASEMESLLNDISKFQGTDQELGAMVDQAIAKFRKTAADTVETFKVTEKSLKGRTAAVSKNELGLRPQSVDILPGQAAEFKEGRPFIPSTMATAEPTKTVAEASKTLSWNLNTKGGMKRPALPPPLVEAEFGQTATAGKDVPHIPSTILNPSTTLDEATAHLHDNLNRLAGPSKVQATQAVAAAEKDLVVEMIDKRLKQNPDTVYKILTSSNVSKDMLQAVKARVGNTAYRAMTAQVIRDFFRTTSPKEMLTRLQRGPMGPRLQAILEPGEYDKLESIAKYANQTKGLSTAWGGWSRLTDLAGHAFAGKEMGIGGIVGYEFGMNALARIMTKPEGMTATQGYLRALARADVRRTAFYTNRIQSIIRREYGVKDTPPPASKTDTAQPLPPPPG